MDIKELYENCTADEIKEIIFDYINKPLSYKAKNNFEEYIEELEKCPICNEYCESDYMTYHKWDIGEIEDKICEQCRNDE